LNHIRFIRFNFFPDGHELKYNKYYIGLSKGRQPFNFVAFRPRKSAINIEVKLPRTDEIDAKIDQAGIEALEYAVRWGAYRLSSTKKISLKTASF